MQPGAASVQPECLQRQECWSEDTLPSLGDLLVEAQTTGPLQWNSSLSSQATKEALNELHGEQVNVIVSGEERQESRQGYSGDCPGPLADEG